MSVQCQFILYHISREPAIIYLQKDVLEALYGLYCFNHILQSCFNRSIITNHFVKEFELSFRQFRCIDF